MPFWKNLYNTLNSTSPLMLLYVLHSRGSSPGRQGFRMIVTSSGQLSGSIGGGVMEHKLVELAKTMLGAEYKPPFLKTQIHKANIAKNKSGMICSGEQTVGFYMLSQKDLEVIRTILRKREENAPGVIVLNHRGLTVLENRKEDYTRIFKAISETEWIYKELINSKAVVYIIGGGHVGKALSRTMNHLDFRVEVFDERENLNTMENNEYAHEKHIVPFDSICNLIEEGPGSYIVLMSFGYKRDKEVLWHLRSLRVNYLGMMGSRAKVDKLFSELKEEGYPVEDLSRIHAPIGIQISSQSPEEIAISIAAEIVKVKNS